MSYLDMYDFFFSFLLSFPLQLANLYLSWGRMEEVSTVIHGFFFASVCMCVYVCVCSYTHTYAHTHIYTHTHIHIHTYTHTHKKGRGQLKGDNEGSCSTRCGSGQCTVTNKPVYRLVFLLFSQSFILYSKVSSIIEQLRAAFSVDVFG